MRNRDERAEHKDQKLRKVGITENLPTLDPARQAEYHEATRAAGTLRALDRMLEAQRETNRLLGELLAATRQSTAPFSTLPPPPAAPGSRPTSEEWRR